MSLRFHPSLACVALALTGCTTNPPLMFGDVTTFGLRLGNDTSTMGGSVSLGYKAQSVAIVPVSVLDADGNVLLLKGSEKVRVGESAKSDAMSVFAAFDSRSGSAADSRSSQVALGQVFSTGLAAQSLTVGLCPTCPKNPGRGEPDVGNAVSSTSKARARDSKREASAATSSPYQSPLLFMRSDVVGIDIGGSLAQQGLQFVIGDSNRNLALIPVAARNGWDKAVPITGDAAEQDGSQLDTLSVIGQFKAETNTAQLNVGLQRYFATGVAARNLSDALKEAVVAKTAEPGASAPATASGATPAAAAVASK